MGAMLNAAHTAQRLSLAGISVPILFFSSLEALDSHELLSEDQRSTALEAIVREFPSSQIGLEPITSIIERLADRVDRGELEFIKPIDLLEAAAGQASVEIATGLRAAGISFESLLESVHQLPLERLRDQLGETPTEIPSKLHRLIPLERESPQLPTESSTGIPEEQYPYAVVVEGLGFRDDDARFPTREEAETALADLERLKRGEFPPNNVLVLRLSRLPPRLHEATRIYIEER
jgi:hypothetical protein